MLKKIRGFTLIELMIVGAIIGILAAVVIPAYISWREEQRQKNQPQIEQTVNSVDGNLKENKIPGLKVE